MLQLPLEPPYEQDPADFTHINSDTQRLTKQLCGMLQLPVEFPYA